MYTEKKKSTMSAKKESKIPWVKTIFEEQAGGVGCGRKWERGGKGRNRVQVLSQEIEIGGGFGQVWRKREGGAKGERKK